MGGEEEKGVEGKMGEGGGKQAGKHCELVSGIQKEREREKVAFFNPSNG